MILHYPGCSLSPISGQCMSSGQIVRSRDSQTLPTARGISSGGIHFSRDQRGWPCSKNDQSCLSHLRGTESPGWTPSPSLSPPWVGEGARPRLFIVC